MNGGGPSRWIWKGLRNNLHFSPSIKSRQIRIDFQIDLENFTAFLMDNTITKSTKSYIVGNFSSIQIDLEFFPDPSGFKSYGLESRQIWRMRGNPDRSGFRSRLIFTVYSKYCILIFIIIIKYQAGKLYNTHYKHGHFFNASGMQTVWILMVS